MREQQGEYDRVQAAYGQMTAALENAAHEKRHSEALILDLEAQTRQDDKAVMYVPVFTWGCKSTLRKACIACNSKHEENLLDYS